MYYDTKLNTGDLSTQDRLLPLAPNIYHQTELPTVAKNEICASPQKTVLRAVSSDSVPSARRSD